MNEQPMVPMKSQSQLTGPEIIALLASRKSAMAAGYGLEEIGLFGSYAEGDAGPDSDIDLLVELKAGHKSFFNFLRLKFELESLLGREVDLVMRSALKPRLRDRILRQVRYV